jgi:hypothetical protein
VWHIVPRPTSRARDKRVGGRPTMNPAPGVVCQAGRTAPVAQLDRAGGFYPSGCAFESCRGREGFPHQGAMLGVKDRLTHPAVATRVNIPLRQIHLGGLAATVQLFDLVPADGTWCVFGTERPRHRPRELCDPRWFRGPPLVGRVPSDPELDSGHALGPFTRWQGCVTSVLRLGHSPGCASRTPGTASRLRRSATDRSVPRSLPCWAWSERTDLGHSAGTNGRLRTRSSWSQTVSVAGRGEVSERVRIGCQHARADRGVRAEEAR